MESPLELAVSLASQARRVREIALATLEEAPRRSSSLLCLYEACRERLAHAPPRPDFADAFAQTAAYGLLSARWLSKDLLPCGSGRFTRRRARAHLSVACPFLHDLFAMALGTPGDRIPIPLGEPPLLAALDEIAALLDRTDIARVFQGAHASGDVSLPILHFYELFLSAYDPSKRKARGVYGTPRPIVTAIVHRVDEALRTELGLPDGLADTTTWGQLALRHPHLVTPEGAGPDTPFVQILDPATGTGTFLVHVIEAISATLSAKWRNAGADDAGVARRLRQYAARHLLARLFAFEIMMAPYAIAHLTVGLKLRELGCPLRPGQRVGIHLMSALEPVDAVVCAPITVVLGNPPYSKISHNLTPAARALVDAYRYIDGQRISERGALQFEINLQDDYIKFMRRAQMLIDRAGAGVIGVITNNGYLGAPTLSGMRRSLLSSFDRISIQNLHGKAGRAAFAGEGDENVFDIQQGVAILLASKTFGAAGVSVRYGELFGRREAKYAHLEASRKACDLTTALKPAPPHYRFDPTDTLLAEEWGRGVNLASIFPLHSAGVLTARDALVIGFTAEEVIEKIHGFRSFSGGDEEACRRYGVARSKRFDPARARRELSLIEDLSAHVVPITYRPFDVRYLFYHKSVVWSRATPVSSQMIGHNNLMLVATRQMTGTAYGHAFISRHPIEIKLCSHDRSCQGFPAYTFSEQGSARGDGRPNVSPAFQAAIGADRALDVAAYVYALLYSTTYRRRFLPFLQSELPAIPVARERALRENLVRLGGRLIAVHLLEDTARPGVTLRGSGEVLIRAAPRFEPPSQGSRGGRGTIHLGDERCLEDVPEDVWRDEIGGYQVCRKWIKDRRGRTLGAREVERYFAIVSALSKTALLMREIDAVIDAHGGFPGAFSA